MNMKSVDFKKSFEAIPGINILIDTDEPRYSVLAVTQGLIDIQPHAF